MPIEEFRYKAGETVNGRYGYKLKVLARRPDARCVRVNSLIAVLPLYKVVTSDMPDNDSLGIGRSAKSAWRMAYRAIIRNEKL